MNYESFVASKLTRMPATGLAVAPELHASLFPHQRDLVTWALKRGRAALFADTGLGKTAMQLEWARHVSAATGKPVLVLAPLAVAAQTQREGLRLGIDVTLVRDGAEVMPGVNVCNYERLHRLDASVFGGVVCDESSILKNYNSKTLRQLLDAFAGTPFKLCATATPSPNDYTELGTHAEFLGACSRVEMLAEYFVHDGGSTQDWRLKGHARSQYWKWVATWAALLRKPSDLGYDDAGYALPPLNVKRHIIPADAETTKAAGFLFAQEASGLMERRDARRASMGARIDRALATIDAEPDESWIVWVDLNAEQDAIAKALGDRCFSVQGSDTLDDKESRIVAFGKGERRIMVTKASVAGFGLNWQHVARVAFVGVTDSWEAYYQAVRRCWRFGQKRPVDVHIFASEIEGAVVDNLARKERDAQKMADELSVETHDAMLAEVRGTVRSTNTYNPSAIRMPEWLVTDRSDA